MFACRLYTRVCVWMKGLSCIYYTNHDSRPNETKYTTSSTCTQLSFRLTSTSKNFTCQPVEVDVVFAGIDHTRWCEALAENMDCRMRLWKILRSPFRILHDMLRVKYGMNHGKFEVTLWRQDSGCNHMHWWTGAGTCLDKFWCCQTWMRSESGIALQECRLSRCGVN